MFIFQVFFLVLVTSVMAEDVCPKKCFCNKQLTSVNCEGHKFLNIPDRLPKSVEKLYMTHNNLIHVNFSTNVVLPNLQYVWLDNNKIAGLQANTFDGNVVPKLSKLYLRNNKISVIESRTFVNLSSLTQVYLSNNDIQKIQPDAFEDTPSVQFINLDGNYLSEIPRLGKLKSLKSLYIQANQISNPTFPDEFKDLKKINDIGLSNNAIRKLDDLTFKNLQNSNVRKLEVTRSKIDEISTGAFKWLRNITSLKLGYNPLTSSDLEMAFHGLVGSSLVSLNIDNITLGGVLPSSTFQLLQNTSITTLSMKNNKMSSIPQKGFANLKKLISLDLSAANIFKIDDSAFEGLDALTRLFLNDNQLSQVPNNLPPSLQKIYLNGNQISALKDNTFKKLSQLQLLYLGGNKIHQLEQNAFYGLTSLKKIHLVDNKIHTLPGRLFESFVVLDSLELNKNNINQIPNGDSLFASMASLQYLNMADNALQSSCSMGLFKVLTSLRYLHLENNQLGDLIARDVNGELFAGMDKLVLLNLTNNQLTQLPDPFFKDLINLKNLTMRSNKISTWGDNLFKRTYKLEILDLSQNMIALVNSSSVRDFKKMKTLDLRQNPFACTCDLRWFRDWTNTTEIMILHSETYLCNSPPEWHGKKFLSFDRHKINCVWFTTTHIICAAAGGFLLFVIVICSVYKRRWYIKLRWYRIRRSLKRSSGTGSGGYQKINGDVNQYDAYISSASDNYQWVLKNIFPGIDSGDLDTETFGGEFKLYFEDRDAEPGKAEVYNIIENMEASRTVLIILTKEYMAKERYKFEIITAIDLLEKGKISDILIVNVDGLTARHVPRLLLRKMERHDFLTWEDSEEAKITFKEQLADGLRRKRRMENVI